MIIVETHSRGNEYTNNNRIIVVYMQQQREHISITVDGLLGDGFLSIPCWSYLENKRRYRAAESMEHALVNLKISDSAIINCTCKCEEVFSKPNHPIKNPLLSVTLTPHT
jgi:hypothetical protein